MKVYPQNIGLGTENMIFFINSQQNLG